MNLKGINEILEYGKNQIKIFCPSLDDFTFTNLTQTMKALLIGQISIHANKLFKSVTGSTSPLENLCSIIDELSKVPIFDDISSLRAVSSKRPRHWSPREDARLLAGVLAWGSGDWQKISNFIGAGRNRSQCLQRWTRTLNPAIKKDTWTEEEDKKLYELVENSDRISWTKIARKMKDRSDVQCRYHYTQLQKAKSMIVPMKHQKLLFNRQVIELPKKDLENSKQSKLYSFTNQNHNMSESQASVLMCVDSFLSRFRRD